MMKKYLLTASIAALSTLLLAGCEKEDKDAISMSDVNKGIQIVEGKGGTEYEVVDLGLLSGNLWAKCNIGATSPEKTGSYFAWAESSPKTNFKWNLYEWCNEDKYSLTKYCAKTDKDDYGYNFFYDDITIIQESDDAATAIMGERWHVPTVDDFRELLTSRNCDIKWCKLNGVEGYLFTSVRKGYEGNSIFIALSGMNDNGNIRFGKQRAYLWSNELYYDDINHHYVSTTASVLELEHTDVDNHVIGSRERYLGLPIRPVYYPE